MIGVSFSDGNRSVPCISVGTALHGVGHKGLTYAFGGSGDVHERNRVSQVGSPWPKSRKLMVQDVLLARGGYLEYASETIFHSYLRLFLDGNRRIVVGGFGTGRQQEIGQGG